MNLLSCLRIICITMDCTKVLRAVHTERRTMNPIKITFASENTFKQISECTSQMSSCPESYQADTSQCLQEDKKNIYSWIQPLGIAALRLIELLDLLLKDGEDGGRQIAGLEPVSEWVLKMIVLGALFVFFQCIIKN